MKLKEISHSELVDLCSQESSDRNAWTEFCSRYDLHIWTVITRECKEKNMFENFSQSKQAVNDLVQEVYVKLVDKDNKALKEFHGRYENSIYLYLGTIAKNVVRNHVVKMGAQKRPPISSSLNDTVMISADGDEIQIADQIESKQDNIEEKISIEMLQKEIDNILEKFLKGRTKTRNKIIFKLNFYEGYTAQEIVSHFNYEMSESRVNNILTDIKKLLRNKLLQKKMLGKRKSVKNIKKFCLVY
jgi:RNA polymerase sigma factor (sigma-70 family)